MTKGLKLLNKKRTSIPVHDCFCTTRETIKQIRKELRALEIIKRKLVNVHYLIHSNHLNDYNKYITFHGFETLTQEEYDLLKEVLCYEIHTNER